MHHMEIFKNPEFGKVRILEEAGQLLFCGADVAGALGYRNASAALQRHCKGVTKRSTPTNGGKQMLLFILESDVYRLIVHSKLPTAERFEHWLFEEVLPSIRRNGAYITQEKIWEIATSPENLLKLCTDLLSQRQENAELRLTNKELQDKAMYFDAFVAADMCTNMRTTAKELQVPEHQFVRFLLSEKYVYRTLSGTVLPYTSEKNQVLFRVKDFMQNGHHGSYTLITPEGKAHFLDLRNQILKTI